MQPIEGSPKAFNDVQRDIKTKISEKKLETPELRKKIDTIRREFSDYIQDEPANYRKFIYHKLGPEGKSASTIDDGNELRMLAKNGDLDSLQLNNFNMEARELVIHIDDYLNKSDKIRDATRAKLVQARQEPIVAIELRDLKENGPPGAYEKALTKHLEKLGKNEISQVLLLTIIQGSHAIARYIKNDPDNKGKFTLSSIDTFVQNTHSKGAVKTFNNLDIT